MNNSSGFTEGTLVHTKRGLVPIQDIRIGDEVLSVDVSQGNERVYKRVEKTFNSIQDIFRCTMLYPKGNQQHTIHYFFSSQNQRVRSASGEWFAVNEIDDSMIDVYTLTDKNLCLWWNKMIYQSKNKSGQTFAISTNTFTDDYHLSGNDEYIDISSEGLIHHKVDDEDFNFSPETEKFLQSSVDWNIFESEILRLSVYQLIIQDTGNYLVGSEGILVHDGS
ncbi:hypothetical protein B9T24_11880 [Acinetobacter sp. ANC 4654]|uniref:hypothetical protein n=1 Tax=Acinetobacter sp. ANC 4654 TaxID=1977872 RepID=UPI000A34BD57|nr:hypothetical protein [Acinetobacter sp. ANC 4654]OTG94451.1 hypothetical protein B9T24_11880 [Acinetobacter sp. ANC 4654]